MDIVYDQSKFRAHLIQCLETNCFTTFPKYKINKTTDTQTIKPSTTDWKIPRRSNRLREKNAKNQKENCNSITLQNRYQLLVQEDSNIINLENQKETVSKNNQEHKKDNLLPSNSSPDSIIYNISNATLTTSEKSLHEKGLNFCPTTPSFNKTKLLDDVFWFCRKMRLSEFFWNTDDLNNNSYNNIDILKKQERSDISNKFSNRFYQPPQNNNEILSHYLTSIKSSIADFCKKPSFHQASNITDEEKIALRNFQSREDIIIHSADKGGEIVVMNKSDYVRECEAQLSNELFYRPVKENLIKEKNIQIIDEITCLKDN